MHDGQNLFDRFTSFAGEWQVDETMEALSQMGLEAIVVGIPNMGEHRLDEYSPFRDARRNQGGQGDRYIEFIANTIKPLIDREFPTQVEPAQTALIGSSMGGLISLYGFFSCPQVFGLAGAMSPALWFGGNKIFDYVKKAAFTPGKIYLDAGTQEEGQTPWRRFLKGQFQTYHAGVRRMHDLLARRGYRPGQDLLYVEDKGAGHNEAAWAYRLPEAIKFLLTINN
jgi:predicted alpha/beta superfamily hydrolase